MLDMTWLRETEEQPVAACVFAFEESPSEYGYDVHKISKAIHNRISPA